MPIQTLAGAAGFAAANCRNLLIIALPFALPAGGGVLTPNEASSVYKFEIKFSMTVFKVQLKSAKSMILNDIATFENEVKQGGDVHALATELFNDCVAFQILVRTSATTVISDLTTIGHDLLELVGGGLPMNGVYPEDFYNGAGGVVDDTRANIKKEIDKLYSSLRSRLQKTQSILRSNGAALTVGLWEPRISYDFFVSEGVSTSLDPAIGLDTLVAVNRTNIAEDGRVHVGGYAAGSTTSVDVTVSGAELQEETVVPAGNRWSAFIDDGGSFFARGNYVVFAQAINDVTATAGNLSFR